MNRYRLHVTNQIIFSQKMPPSNPYFSNLERRVLLGPCQRFSEVQRASIALLLSTNAVTLPQKTTRRQAGLAQGEAVLLSLITSLSSICLRIVSVRFPGTDVTLSGFLFNQQLFTIKYSLSIFAYFKCFLLCFHFQITLKFRKIILNMTYI